jgi:hypothetical protein
MLMLSLKPTSKCFRTLVSLHCWGHSDELNDHVSDRSLSLSVSVYTYIHISLPMRRLNTEMADREGFVAFIWYESFKSCIILEVSIIIIVIIIIIIHYSYIISFNGGGLKVQQLLARCGVRNTKAL